VCHFAKITETAVDQGDRSNTNCENRENEMTLPLIVVVVVVVVVAVIDSPPSSPLLRLQCAMNRRNALLASELLR
jgi:hypothetical protein